MALESKLTKFLNERKWLIPLLFFMMCFFFTAVIVIWEIKRPENLESTFAFSIGGEMCAIIVSIMMTLSILPAYKRQSGYVRMFVTLLTICCSLCFLDTLQMCIDGVPQLATLNKVIAIFVFANEAVYVFFFWLFVIYALNLEGRTVGILSQIVFFGLIIFSLLPFVNLFYPFYFTMSEDGVYARNPTFWWICRVFLILVAIFVVVAVIISKEKKKNKIVILVFMLLPFVAVGIGGYKYGISLLYTTMVVSLVMIYAFLFSDNEKVLYSTNKELGLATNIQKHMLPSIFPAFPERKEFDIYASMDPAKEVGGDFYDFFLIDDDHLGLVIADVSDKGVPAALFMMASKIMVQNYALLGYSPKEVLTRVNKQICINNQEEMFVTVWLGILDLKTGIVTASNAGHEKPVIKKPNGDFEVLNDKHGFVVGSFPGSVYTDYEIKLEKGMKLYVYTDGAPEARNNNEQFGMKRLVESLNKYKDLPVLDICNNVTNDIYAFMDNTSQFDDITMLCLEYRGYEAEVRSVEINASLEDISKGIKPVMDLLKENDVEHKVAYKIEVALDEILTNVSSYAYDNKDGKVTIEYQIQESPMKMVVIKIIDEGKPFNPLEVEEPDISLDVADRPIGGLGVFIVKKTMDEVHYDRKNNKNILTMKKKI